MLFEKRIVSDGRKEFPKFIFLIWIIFLGVLGVTQASAVTSRIIRQSSNSEFAKGETEEVTLDSKGTIKLGRASKILVKDFTDTENELGRKDADYEPWSINSIMPSGESLYIGTSPNGGIYKYTMGKLSKIYPVDSADAEEQESVSGNQKEPNEPNKVEVKEHLKNEHIFAMATDVSGRILAGISGEKCVLYRFEKNEPVKIYEPNNCKYIFDIEVAEDGDIYLGTGPEGQILHLNSFGQQPEVLFDSTDKNILSILAADNVLYAGSDTRALVYEIDRQTKKVKVLYDSDQPEVTSLVLSVGEQRKELYAAATSAEVVGTELKFATAQVAAGRPEKAESRDDAGKGKSSLNLKIANTKENDSEKKAQRAAIMKRRGKPTKASYIYKIDEKGYVTEIFSESAVFFTLAEKEQKLLLGTGNKGRLFEMEPATERKEVIYQDKQASQVTAVSATEEAIFLGTANPAKLIRLSDDFANEGTYTSELIDGSEPTKWGKLQIEADIPERCGVRMSCRSGNVKDVNDPTFSDWTEPVEVKGPVQMQCPLGRFLQYKLVLQSESGKDTPVVREVAVAHTIPNIKPVVQSVSLERVKGKEGLFKISYQAKDGNDDKLIYKIDFRKKGRTSWIVLKDDHEEDHYQWDSKTVEDGRYEIRVTANDVRDNMPQRSLTGSRVSEPVIVDNTGPVIQQGAILTRIKEKEPAAVLRMTVKDELSAIGSVHYTVNSDDEWNSTLPEDRVYDTTEEKFVIEISELDEGENIVAVKVTDNVGNTTYKSFEVEGGKD